MQCNNCGADNGDDNVYCGKCGNLFGELSKELHEAVTAAVENTLNSKLRDQRVVEIETSEVVANKVLGWAKVAGLAIGIPIAVLGFLGIKSYKDFQAVVEKSESAVLASQATIEESTTLIKQNVDRAIEKVAVIGQLEKDMSTRLAELTSYVESTQTDLNVAQGLIAIPQGNLVSSHSDEEIVSAINTLASDGILESGDDFFILSLSEQYYMQTILTNADSFHVEYRGGGADRHFKCKENPTKEALIESMMSYRIGNPNFRLLCDWEYLPT